MEETKDFTTITIDESIQFVNERRKRFKLFKMLTIGVAAVCIVGCIYLTNGIIENNDSKNQRQAQSALAELARLNQESAGTDGEISAGLQSLVAAKFNPKQTDLPKAVTAPLFTLEKRKHLPNHLSHDLLMQVHGWANDPEWYLGEMQKNVKRRLENPIREKLLNENDSTSEITLGISGEGRFLWHQQMHCVNEILMQTFAKENVTVNVRRGRPYDHYIYKVGGENYFDMYKEQQISWMTCAAQRATAGRKLRAQPNHDWQASSEENNEEDLQQVELITNEESGCACTVL